MRSAWFPALLLAAACSAIALEPPDFAIRLTDQTFKAMSWPAAAGNGPWRLDSPDVAAELTYLQDNRWRLRLTARTNITDVTFPWPGNEPARALSSPGAIYYSMYLLGIARRVDSLDQFEWNGVHYPGGCHAPLIVCATEQEAKLVAATNWPPRRVLPNMSGRGMAIVEERFLPSGQTREYEVMVAHFRRSEPQPQPIWADAVDAYRAWLQPHLRDENLLPRPLPDWMAEAHGWHAIGLQNQTIFRPAEVLRLCEHWKSVFPWVQFWGQMSNYCGPAHLAQPRLAPGEEAGCCLEKIGFHERYRQGLPALAARVASWGHVGYYHRPPDKGSLENPQHRKFVLDWFDWAKSNHADAFYLDVIGNDYYGDALLVAKFLRDQAPPATVIEYSMDVYSLPALFSGSLAGGDLKGSSRAWRELLSGGREVATCPEFGRYLIQDRTIFMGECNGDHVTWGRRNGYWGERQAFLLGAKLDVLSPWEGENPYGPLNLMVDAIIRERERVRWWSRDPVYLHRAHLEYVPREIDARVFQASDGALLIACDNPLRLRGLKLKVAGTELEIPGVPIRILDAPAPGR